MRAVLSGWVRQRHQRTAMEISTALSRCNCRPLDHRTEKRPERMDRM